MNRFARTLACCSFGFLLVGCGGLGPGLIGQQLPQVRVFNAIDGQASVTVNFKDQYGNSLGTSVATNNGAASAQDAIIANTKATPTVSGGGVALFTGSASQYRINSDYSLYVGGKPGSYSAIALNDVPGAGSTAGSSDFRCVHVGVNTAPVDVYILPVVQTTVSGTPLFSSMAYGGVSTSVNAAGAVDGNGYTLQPVTTGGARYQVVVTAHKSTTALASTTVTLLDTVFYTVAVYDTSAGTGVAVLSDRH